MKKKLTQFRWLVTMLLLVTAMAMPKMAWAQVKYTVFDSSSGTLTFKYGVKPTGGEGITVYDIPDFSRSPEWNSQASSITTVVFDESFKDVRPKNCYCWFQSCSSLTTINGIENLNTEDVTDMDYMFYNCSSLTTLDLSGFNTAKVKYMHKMFFGCSELTTIYASSNFTTSAVTSSDDMFSGCTSLVGAKPFDSNTLDKTYANYQNGYFTYGIKTKDDLAMFANKVNGTYTPAEGETATAYTTICAELMADLTLTDTDVLPAIGSSGYSGTFDGCGHTISGLNFSSTSSALFAQNSGTIKNLGIVEATIAEGANGSFCQTNNGTIESCFFMGTTTGSSQSAGGICQTNNGTITNCYYLADSETDAIEGTTYKTTAQFKSGEVCYLLNEGKTDGTQIWYQNLAAEGDTWPVCNNTGNNTVYYAILFCGGTSNVGNTYANTPTVVIDHDMTEEVSLNSVKQIYQKGCKREGCEHADYYATSDGSVEAQLEGGTYKVASFDLADATAYNSEAEFTVTSLAYKRKFYDDKWMAVYVPFAIDCSKLETDYEMATINNFHEYEQEDGTYNVVLEVKRVTKGGTIPALTPCLMRMKTAPAAKVEKTLTFENAEFSAAADKSIDCSSVTRYYQFFGTLNGKTGLTAATDFVLNAGKLYKTSENTELLPQRWYLSATDRTSTPVEPAAMLRSISIKVIGDGEATGIEDIHVNTESGADASGSTGIYDLQGRKINSEPTKGMYIKNGKKYIK